MIAQSITYVLIYRDDSETHHTTKEYEKYWQPEREIAQHAQSAANSRKERVQYSYQHIGAKCVKCSADGFHRDFADPIQERIQHGCYGYVDISLPPEKGGRLDFRGRFSNGRPASGQIEIHPGFRKWDITGWEHQPNIPTSFCGNAAVIIGASAILCGGRRGFDTRDEALEFLRGDLVVEDCATQEHRIVGKLLDLVITNPCPGPAACPHATPRGQRKAYRKCVWAPITSLD